MHVKFKFKENDKRKYAFKLEMRRIYGKIHRIQRKYENSVTLLP